eukprot:CAMPEP_0176066374 /NCGR_PEP_ID=MMETSP0120_2-20121206/33122_1 /TAXON_ID=160619 /ORGANISM="Kryptoperidinium foliaceum, Strain CCMP 1326" /LENGTH=533 /DNA_ID=CAMNT_0017399977 /DNA_START=77 /DNA_END=1678 /DNA_ORIENTATION=-
MSLVCAMRVSVLLVFVVGGGAGGSLLDGIAVALGDSGVDFLAASAAGLPRIEAGLAPILPSLPRSESGRLEGPAVRYALYHFFVREFGWRINGLDPMGAPWNSSSPAEVAALKRMPPAVLQLLASRLDNDGLDERDLAVLAWTLRYLIQDETDTRLRLAYDMLELSVDTPLPTDHAEMALDLHMASHVAAADLAKTPAKTMMKVYANMEKLYPAWNDTLDFIHQAYVSEVGAPAVSTVTFDQNLRVISNITERYGLWQDSECKAMKAMLLPWEDQGSGRVHLTDFYRASLAGKWQFSEKVDYLRQLGALDESVPGSPRVIIVNYLLSYSNCVGSTPYNDLCCLSECEALMAHVERQVAASSAEPEALMDIVVALASSTVPAGRELGAVLQQRLRSVAAQHGGVVPIYGRLFAQWMHHAYPRECPYPHVVGATQQITPAHYLRQGDGLRVASAEEMKVVVERPERKDHPQETLPWDSQEELLAPPSPRAPIGFAVLHLGTSAVAMGLLMASLLGVTVRRRRSAAKPAVAPQIFV